MIPKHLPHVRYDSDRSRYCVTDDWDFGDYDATWHFHMLNVYPEWQWEEASR